MTETLSGRRVEIAWPDLGITVAAELDDRNPALADALWEALPYQSLQGHALVAGSHLYHVAPIPSLLHLPASHRFDRREAPDGTVFCSALQHLGIKYGTLTEPMLASPVGQVRPEDLAALIEAGRAVWDSVYSTKKPVLVEVRKAGTGGGHRIPHLTAADPDANRLIHDVYAETERIWLSEPAELADLHRGWIPSGAGSFETVLPTLLFVNGETRPLGYATYGGLVRGVVADMPMDSLRQMARLLVGIPAEFLGYCGLEKLWDFTQRFQSCLDHLDRDDFLAVVSQMALYVNCLGGWNLHLFPWDTGDHLRQQRPAEVSQPS
ncbi:cucumopine synthase-related protein [Streptomyces sp. KR80]|uniref:cucumopine synthase-related protein n=1 Tax=Streptomyces sp. KR80 TaxID=3457426 RepID=UPI003FD41097